MIENPNNPDAKQPEQSDYIQRQQIRPQHWQPQSDYSTTNFQQTPPIIQNQQVSLPSHASTNPKKIITVTAIIALVIGLIAGWTVQTIRTNMVITKQNNEIKKLNTTIDSLQTQLQSLTGAQSDDPGNGYEDNDSKKNSGNIQGKTGDTISNGGITMKLINAGEQATINYDTCGDGCSNNTYAPKSPDSTAKYWVATVEVTNNTQKPLDITCSYPYEIIALNSKNQQYTPIDDLFQVEGNPRCNAELQPGMTSTVTYPFQVPASTKIVALAFRDVGDFLTGEPGEDKYSYFIVDDDYYIG